MSKQFSLAIITPEREFFNDMVEAVTIDGDGGVLTVLANHTPLVASIKIGELSIKKDGKWKLASHSEGFMEVRPEATLVFVQSAEWPEEINETRAEAAARRAEERLKEMQTISEHRRTEAMLNRALIRMRISKSRR